MSNKSFFHPDEIIFASTTSCNLKCAHCFVSRNPLKITIEDAVKFMQSARNSKNNTIEKIGFSGGEPFLYQDFLCAVTKEAVNLDFIFDRLMTNGVWWKNEEELTEALNKLYEAGYDGKIGLSWDYFHDQDFEKIYIFCKNVLKIFGGFSLEIQSVLPFDAKDTSFVKKAENKLFKEFAELSKRLNLKMKKSLHPFRKTGLIQLYNEENLITIYRTPETFPCSDGRGWKSKKWFKEDFCEGPGQILYIHSSGKIAPCCGFANENNRLLIGNISQTYDEILINGEANEFLKLCFKKGLSTLAKKLTEERKLSRKTKDPCTFCDYVCKYNL